MPAAAPGSALAVLILPTLLVSIDNTVLGVALPAISAALRAGRDELLWIVDVYPLVLAGLLVTMGTLGDRIGSRRLLLIGVAGFGAVSVAAAFATDAAQLVAARALLGVFGAMLMPSTLALLRTLFVDRARRRLALAIWATGFAAGAALGPGARRRAAGALLVGLGVPGERAGDGGCCWSLAPLLLPECRAAGRRQARPAGPASCRC